MIGEVVGQSVAVKRIVVEVVGLGVGQPNAAGTLADPYVVYLRGILEIIAVR